VLRVGPHVRVEPVQLIGGLSAKRESEELFIRIEDGELVQKLLGFTSRVIKKKERFVAPGSARHRCHELENRLVSDSNAVPFDTLTQEASGA